MGKPAKTRPDSKSRLRILLIEDDEDDFILTRDMLSAAVGDEFELERSPGYAEAQERIAADRFDLYMVDHRLGDGSGIDLVGEILSNNPSASIIMLTGVENRELDLAAMNAGAYDFLVKGQLTPATLERGLRYALERKRSEQALQHSEQRFRDMLAASSDWYWETDAGLRYTEVSDRFFDITGLDRSVVFEAGFNDIIGQEVNRDKLDSLNAKFRQHAPFRDFEFPINCRDGEIRWVRTSGVPTLNANGEFGGYRGTGTDITNEVTAKRTAALAQIRLADAIASISEGFALWDTNDRLVLFNHRYLEEFGDDTDIPQIGILFRDLVTERVRRGHISEALGNESAWIEERIAQHRSCTGTREIRLRDGRWIRVTERRTKEGSTAVIRTDITELKQREQALRASERRFRDMLEATTDWYWEWNAELLPVYVSEKFFGITGYKEAEVIGEPWESLVADGVDPEARHVYQEALAKRQAFRRFIAPINSAEGSIVWMSISGKPIFNDQGDFLGYRGTGADITEGIRVKHAAELAQKRLLDAIECIPGGFLLCDSQDRLVLWNRRFTEAYGDDAEVFQPGAPYESTIRRRVENGHILDAIGHEEEWIQRRLKQHRDPRGATEFELTNGEWVRVLERRTSEGGVVSIRTDVTEMKRREQAIAESERRWRAILENAAVGIASFSPDGKILAANETLCKILGRDQETLHDFDCKQLLHNADREIYADLFSSSGDDTEAGSRPAELRFLDPRGANVFTEVELAPVGGTPGEPDYFVAVIRDITEAKRAETEIARLGRVVDESLNEIYIFDSETLKFVQVNRGARRNLHYSTRELSEMTPLDLKPGFDEASFRALLEPLLTGTQDSVYFETEHQRKDGTRYPVEVHLQLSQKDNPPLFIAIIRDLSERIEAEMRLRQAQKMEAIGQLAGGIAHDFNNVLTVISGNLGLLSRELTGEFPDKDWDDLLDDAISAANRARELTRGLLSVSRKDQFVSTEVDVDAVIDEVRKLLRRTLPPNIAIGVETKTGARYVTTDETQLHTALLNLGLNARDAMPDGGLLTFQTRIENVTTSDAKQDGLQLRPGRYIAIEVRDTGVGMQPEVTERVLDPLFTTKSKGKGTGLGLTMVSSFVRESGGEISIESELDKGSAFTLYLPMASVDVVEQRSDEEEPLTETGNYSRILVCDDEQEILRFVGRCLERVGYQVVRAMDAEQTLEALQKNKAFAALLSDIQLPGKMDGIELAAEIRQRAPNLPIMLMTASSLAADKAQERFGQTVPVLRKPFSVEEMVGAVEELIPENRFPRDEPDTKLE